MKDECLICGAPLKYLENDGLMECAVCHKKENSKTVCENGHYVCNECHTQGDGQHYRRVPCREVQGSHCHYQKTDGSAIFYHNII